MLVCAQEFGKVSYYSSHLQGRRMSNGERYDARDLTAAHRKFPFGTILKVTNLDNGLFVVVRVTDRGPFYRGRVVDLSYAAAQRVGLIAAGHANAKVEEAEDLRFILYSETLLRLDLPVPLEDIPLKLPLYINSQVNGLPHLGE